jgi:signal transduction histidine kinase
LATRSSPADVRPLDPLSSIKAKLGVVIVATVAVTVGVVIVGSHLEWALWERGVAAALVGLGMVQLLARGMTSPLREMAAAASAMAKGDYGRRVTATSRDEVGELARAFNKMASELAEVDRVRRDLVANVSHELRTPISALQAVLENLVDGVEPPDAATLATMLKQVERLGRLVSQLLDLSRLESGGVPLQREPFLLRPLFERVVAESRLPARSAPAQGVDISIDVTPEDLAIEGDAERVHQVVGNLLENALRHSPNGGTVMIRGTRTEDLIRIEVADEGPGISEQDAARVFERFYRSDGARTSSNGGAGLGLAIARWIVELHGGDIRADRRVPHGCRMVVELPRVSA